VQRARLSPSSRQSIIWNYGELRPKIQRFQQDGDPYLEYIFRLQPFTLLQAPNSNAIYLGMFDPIQSQLPIYFSLLWHIQKFCKGGESNPTLNLAKEATRNTLFKNSKLFYLMDYFTISFAGYSVQKV
jgi:hypothetical protein